MKTRLLLLALLFAQMLSAQWEKLPMPDCDNIQFLGTAHNRVWAQCLSGKNYFSDDQGLNWQHWTVSDTIEARKIWVSDQVLFALSQWSSLPEYEETIYKSTDNGNTWQAIFHDTLSQFSIPDNVFGADGYIFFLDQSPPAPAWGSYLYRSADQGATWQNMNVLGNGTWDNTLNGAYAGGGALIASICKQDGIGDAWCYDLKSFDFGKTWENIGVPFDPEEFINDQYWILKGDSNDPLIYFSNNGGVTISTLPRSDCRIKYYFAPPYSLYSFNTSGIGCLELWDNSTHTWQTLTAPPVSFYFLAQTELGTLFAGSHEHGLWRFPVQSSAVGSPNGESFSVLSITPNPSQQQVEIKWPADTPLGSPLFVYDLYGKLLFKTEKGNSLSIRLDIKDWNSGFYFVKTGHCVSQLVKS